MTTALTLAVVAVFLWLLCRCSHEDEVVKYDEYGCHTLKCLHCGRETTIDPYGGIEG